MKQFFDSWRGFASKKTVISEQQTIELEDTIIVSSDNEDEEEDSRDWFDMDSDEVTEEDHYHLPRNESWMKIYGNIVRKSYDYIEELVGSTSLIKNPQFYINAIKLGNRGGDVYWPTRNVDIYWKGFDHSSAMDNEMYADMALTYWGTTAYEKPKDRAGAKAKVELRGRINQKMYLIKAKNLWRVLIEEWINGRALSYDMPNDGDWKELQKIINDQAHAHEIGEIINSLEDIVAFFMSTTTIHELAHMSYFASMQQKKGIEADEAGDELKSEFYSAETEEQAYKVEAAFYNSNISRVTNSVFENLNPYFLGSRLRAALKYVESTLAKEFDVLQKRHGQEAARLKRADKAVKGRVRAQSQNVPLAGTAVARNASDNSLEEGFSSRGQSATLDAFKSWRKYTINEQSTYKVVKKDTLSAIAKRFGVKLSILKKLNPQFKKNWDLIRPGEEVSLPADVKGASGPGNKPPPGGESDNAAADQEAEERRITEASLKDYLREIRHLYVSWYALRSLLISPYGAWRIHGQSGSNIESAQNKIEEKLNHLKYEHEWGRRLYSNKEWSALADKKFDEYQAEAKNISDSVTDSHPWPDEGVREITSQTFTILEAYIYSKGTETPAELKENCKITVIFADKALKG
jgi:LysM repeat protein